MPPLHPAIVHFPIALFPLAVIDESLSYLKNNQSAPVVA
jgi:uncharacterized membrane protein